MRVISTVSAVALAAVSVSGCSGGPQDPVSAIPIPASSGSRGLETLPPTTVRLWIASTSQSYIFGENASGRKTVATIDAGANGCANPTGVKVDHKQNLWVACASGSVQKYSSGSSVPSAAYDDSYSYGSERLEAAPLKGGGGGHSYFAGYPTGVAFSRGHVFAANALSEGCSDSATIRPNLMECFDGPIVWWNAGSANKVRLSFSTQAETAAYDLDVDNAGDVFFDGGYYCQYSCEPALFELSDPTSSSYVLTELTPPTADRLGGVYISNGGSVLNVVDETARTVSQYRLPWVASETPFNVLGPTLTRMGKGEPTSGGFDKGDKQLALADADGWVDVGTVAGNRWSTVGNKNLKNGNYGAAYVPSDK